MQLISLNSDNEEVSSTSAVLYQALIDSGCDVLWDDRLETAGVKFNDSDLLGLPLRIIVSPRNLKDGVIELKRRRDDSSSKIGLDDVVPEAKILLAKDDL